MNDVTAPILQNLGLATEKFSLAIEECALLLAAIATITVALLEFLKGLFCARLFFHKYRLRKLISDQEARDQIIELAVGGELPRALYNQHTEKMMANLLSAATVSIEHPSQYPELFKFLTDHSFRVPRNGGATTNGQLDHDSALRFQRLIGRKFEAFRLQTEYVWTRWNQGIAVTGAGFLLYYLLEDSGLAQPATLSLAIAGGVMTPFAKDLVAALAGLRARKTGAGGG